MGNTLPARRLVTLSCIASTLLLSSCATDIDTAYRVQEAALVWEAEVPFAPLGLRCLDTGAAEVSSEALGASAQDLPPTVGFDASGCPVTESSWVDVPQQRKSQMVVRESPAKTGYVVLDYNWEERHYEKPDRGRAHPPTPRESESTIIVTEKVRLDSIVKMVNPAGRILWEVPGPANAHVFSVDDSVIGLWGKDPSIVQNNPRGSVYSEEYAGRISGVYADSPTQVLFLDVSTGSTTAQFEIPPSMEPSAVLENHDLAGNVAFLALDRNYDVIDGYAVYDCSDGHEIVLVDLVELLPRVIIRDIAPCSAGLVASGEDGSVSLLTLRGQHLWSKVPPTSSKSIMSIPQLLRSSDGGLLAVSYSPGLGKSSLSITVFDRRGTCFFNRGDYGAIRKAESANRVVAIGRGTSTDSRGLWAFDLEPDRLVVADLRISSAVRDWALSPSGEYLLVVTRIGESDGEVAMYRLAGE